MTIQLPQDVANAIEAAVRSGRFTSADDALAEAWRCFQRRNQPPRSEPDAVASSDDPAPDLVVGEGAEKRRADADMPIWERIIERTARIPDEEWDKLPVDLAEQHDHYLYGTPKRPIR